jgi:tetratricopeptide (TPR) repeat protein
MIPILLTVVLFAQAAPSSSARLHFQAGVEASKRNQVETAIAEFKQAISLEPGDPASYVGLGQAYMQASRYDEAIPALNRALELGHDLVAAHRLLGYALLTQGYAADASPHLEQAGERGALGIAQIETNKFADAVTNLQAALAATPDDPDLLYYLGRASQMLANESNEKLLTRFVQSARAHQLKAQNYFVLHQLPKAEAEYRSALAVRSNLPGIHLELGQVFAEGAQWSKAEQEFRQERKIRPGNAEAPYRLGQVLLQQGRVQEATLELKRSDELLPNMPETLQALAKAAFLSGDKVLAQKSWTRLLAIESESELAAQAHLGLAGLYRTEGKQAEAEKEMQEFRRLRDSQRQHLQTQP